MTTATIGACARCGERHEDVTVQERPVDDAGRNARFACPTTGRPTVAKVDLEE